MINSLLERNKKKIVIDRLFVSENDKNYMIFDPNTIKNKVNNHFQNIALPDTTPPPINNRWINQYTPLPIIDSHWYCNILQLPDINEWMACIRELPNDKAAGPSNIFNEHLKHLGLETQTLLLHLIHLIF